MSNNFLTGLKEKKNFMKVSMTALVGAMSLYAGASLYSANAMKPDSTVVSTSNSADQSDTKVEMVDEELENLKSSAANLYQAIESGDADKVCEVVDEARFSNISSVLCFADLLSEKQNLDLLTRIYDLYTAASMEDFDEVCELLKDTDDRLVNITLRLAIREKNDMVADVISKVRVDMFCEEHGGKCDTEKGTINLNSCTLDTEALDSLVDVLEDDHMFWSLSLRSCDLGDEDAQRISKLLKKNTTLCVLDLAGDPLGSDVIGDEGAICISEALKVNTSLTQLSMSFNNIGAVGASKLSEALKENRSITMLNLNVNDIGSEGAVELFEALKVNTSLTLLRLDQNDIGLEGAARLSEALKVNTSLTRLDLFGNSVETAGAVKISEGLETNEALTDLNLMCNKIGDEGIRYMAEALKKNSTLTALNLGNNRPEDKGIVALFEMFQKNITVTDVNAGISPLG